MKTKNDLLILNKQKYNMFCLTDKISPANCPWFSEIVAAVRARYPKGTRVELISMNDPYSIRESRQCGHPGKGWADSEHQSDDADGMRHHGTGGGAEPPADRDGCGDRHDGKDCGEKQSCSHGPGRIPETPQWTDRPDETARDGYEKASREISDRQGKRKTYMRFIGGLQKLDGFCGKFDEELWTALLDHATVYAMDDICFTFKAGNEVKVDG